MVFFVEFFVRRNSFFYNFGGVIFFYFNSLRHMHEMIKPDNRKGSLRRSADENLIFFSQMTMSIGRLSFGRSAKGNVVIKR